jgi:cell division septation protein DedD
VFINTFLIYISSTPTVDTCICFVLLHVASFPQDVVRQPDQLLTDMTILLCGINVPPTSGAATAVNTQPQTSNPPQQQQQQQQPAKPTPAPQKPPAAAAVTYPPPRPVFTPQQPVVQQPQQPATSVQLGVYKGSIQCEGFGMQVSRQTYCYLTHWGVSCDRV